MVTAVVYLAEGARTYLDFVVGQRDPDAVLAQDVTEAAAMYQERLPIVREPARDEARRSGRSSMH